MENRGVLRGAACPSKAISAAAVSALLVPLFDAPSRPVRGVVLSVHAAALNLVVDGHLLTIASARAGGLPNGILVAHPFDPRARGVRVGMAVDIANRRLRIDAAGVSIDVAGAPRWDPRLRPQARPPDLAGRVALARRVETGRPSGLAGVALLSDALGAFDVYDSLESAVASGSAAAIARAGRGLIGLGAGLTPAGDDVLVGLTAGLTGVGDPRGLRLARTWARQASGRTTAVAVAFHRHAAGGAYSERLHSVLGAVLNGPIGAIPRVVEAAAAWGATSGIDTLAGILLALDPPGTRAGGRSATLHAA